MSNEPLIKFQDHGVAPILSYNVPEPVTYFGFNIVELPVPETHSEFETLVPPVKEPEKITAEQVRQAMLDGFQDENLFPAITIEKPLRYYEASSALELWVAQGPTGEQSYGVDHLLVLEDLPVKDGRDARTGVPSKTFGLWPRFLENTMNRALTDLTPGVVADYLKRGERLWVFFDDKSQLFDVKFVKPDQAKPRLAIIETYRLTSYLGDYGAGRTVHTFSLLPGEKTRISIKTYSKTTQTRNEASSILDSYSRETAEDFERAVKSEESDKEESARRDEWRIEADAENNFGAVSVKASAGYAGSAAAGREQFAKNVANATSKSATRASNKRDIQIQQKSQTQAEMGLQEGTEREIQNVNTGRVLNFVFRQMNQEFITILHLVDARVAFMDAFRQDSLRVVPLPDLDALLADVIKDSPGDAWRQEVRDMVRGALENVFDYQDKIHSLVEERTLGEGGVHYLRVRSDIVSKYDGRIDVPGIILSTQRNVLRTDGVVVEALLGAGEGLDEYARGLQEEQVRARRLANRALSAQVRREELAREILADGDADAAALFEQAFHKTSLSRLPIP